MPNHISNVVTISGEKSELLKLMDLVESKEESKSEQPNAFSFESYFPCTNKEDWYNWNINNWGTKWDAYEVGRWLCDWEKKSMTISFQTAWSTPFFALIKLSTIIPTISIYCEYADEDMGYNVGTYSIVNGEVIEETCPEVNGSQEAIDFAEKIHTKAFELFELTNKNYQN
jgi:hypothetical protein